jgi:hypothetical protein
VHNDRLIDALRAQAFSALNTSAGARAYYDALRGRGTEHEPALRQLGNRQVGILHGCLKTRTAYDEETAWAHHAEAPDKTPPDQTPPNPPGHQRPGRQRRGSRPGAGTDPPADTRLPKAC